MIYFCLMSRSYKFHKPEAAYFVSFAVVEWLDVFTRNEYKDILVESLSHCQTNKGMEIYAWCIMANHVHLVFRSMGDQPPQRLLGDFKRHTSKTVVKAIENNHRESGKNFCWLHSEKRLRDHRTFRNINSGGITIGLFNSGATK